MSELFENSDICGTIKGCANHNLVSIPWLKSVQELRDGRQRNRAQTQLSAFDYSERREDNAGSQDLESTFVGRVIDCIV
jgi:hypothetical protein